MSFLSAQRRDANERAIIDVLHSAGAFVMQMDKSAGFDLLVIDRKKNIYIAEVKQPGRKFTAREVALFNVLREMGVMMHILHNEIEALRMIGVQDDKYN
jgi:hypothetical protein